MPEGVQQRYGAICGEPVGRPAPITTGEVFRMKSGRFVTNNAGNMEVADDGDTLLAGWMEQGGDYTTVAGDHATMHWAENNLNVIYRIPVIAGTYVASMLGKTCDLVRATVGGVTNIQGAKLDASGEDNLRIVGGDLVGNFYVDVIYVVAKLTAGTGVV